MGVWRHAEQEGENRLPAAKQDHHDKVDDGGDDDDGDDDHDGDHDGAGSSFLLRYQAGLAAFYNEWWCIPTSKQRMAKLLKTTACCKV